jgi:purine-binding chemotaxis protein CheW
MTTATVTQTRAKAGKYLTFALGKEEYGIAILKVREIIGYMTITAVPRCPIMSEVSSIFAAR